MVNNRLKVYGGEGTYMTSVGEELLRQGHIVQYFGLRDETGLHGNDFGIYAKKSKLPTKLFKNNFNRRQFSKILNLFKPDIVHLNLIYFTLTPSIIIEAKKRNIPIVQTVHDGKIICPSYQLFVSRENKPCSICAVKDFKNCYRKKCHKNSKITSFIAYREALYNERKGYYYLINKFIFPSEFMMNLHILYGISPDKCLKIHNFSRIKKRTSLTKVEEKYVLFFGRVIKIKGTEILSSVVRNLPEINFVVAGTGDDARLFDGIPNCKLVGFQSGKKLEELISNAICTVFPSICYENCPMGILESMALGTPVIGSNIGGIPELIIDGVNGFLFPSGDVDELCRKIKKIYYDKKMCAEMSRECLELSSIDSVETYTKRIVQIYEDLLNKEHFYDK